MQEPPVVPTARRRRWVVPVAVAAVALAGIGVGVAIAKSRRHVDVRCSDQQRAGSYQPGLYDVDERRRPLGPDIRRLVSGHDGLDGPADDRRLDDGIDDVGRPPTACCRPAEPGWKSSVQRPSPRVVREHDARHVTPHERRLGALGRLDARPDDGRLTRRIYSSACSSTERSSRSSRSSSSRRLSRTSGGSDCVAGRIHRTLTSRGLSSARPLSEITA